MSTGIHFISQYLIEENRENAVIGKRPLSLSSPTQRHRYAWLECANGTWYFLTDLFADPAESTRKWSDRKSALDELNSEGWIVIRPYPERSSEEKPPSNHLYGYGLMRNIH